MHPDSENLLRLPTLPSTMPFGRFIAAVAAACPDRIVPAATTWRATVIGNWASEPDAWRDADAIDLAARQWALATAFAVFASLIRMIDRTAQAPTLPRLDS